MCCFFPESQSEQLSGSESATAGNGLPDLRLEDSTVVEDPEGKHWVLEGMRAQRPVSLGTLLG